MTVLELALARIDVDGAVCAFGTTCADTMIGRGGLDVHHAWPVFMGGPATGADTLACPNHHRRQHALLRYLVECDQDGTAPAWAVRRRYNVIERDTAAWGVEQWIAAGRPPIRGWNVPAARAA